MIMFFCLPNSFVTDQITKLFLYVNDNLFLCSLFTVGCEMVKGGWVLHSVAVYGALNKVLACLSPFPISNHEVL